MTALLLILRSPPKAGVSKDEAACIDRRMGKICFGAIALLFFAMASPLEARQQDSDATDFRTYVQKLWPQAQQRGVTRATFDSAFAGIAPDPSVVALTKKQAEYGRPVGVYVGGAVSAARLAGGARQLEQWSDALNVIERRFGVPREIIIAIWGMETNYGANPGGKDIIRSLVSLAASGYRESFCREELLNALLILQQGHIARDKMTGSWAGAMGQPQFIPSSFMRWSADFEGDGTRDIWTNVPDVLASIANYFRENGWQPDLIWGFEAIVPRGFDFAVSRADFSQWHTMGFRRADGGAWPASGSAYLLFPAGANGPAFLVTSNFETIKRYNISDAYALAIAHMADRFRGAAPFVKPWPKDDVQLTRSERIFLQRALAARGYKVDNFVGQIDFTQRDAIRQLQARAGLTPDGHPANDLLLWLAAHPAKGGRRR